MAGWLRRGLVAVSLTASICGCANVKVQKVDLQDRMNGQDDHVQGFRYYLTRPYLVIASRVSASITYLPVWPAKLKNPSTDQEKQSLYLVGAVPDENGTYPVYDHAGQLTQMKSSQLTLFTIPIKRTNDGQGGAKLPTRTNLESAVVKAVGDSMSNLITIAPADSTSVQTRLRTAFETDPDYTKIQTLLTTGQDLATAIQVGVHNVVVEANKYLKEKAVTGTVDEGTITKVVTAAFPQGVSAPASQTADKTVVGALATLQTVPAPGKGQTQNQTTSTPPATTPVQDTLPFQVVFLPDFEEQYAIRNINVLAKTKYRYTFRNGTDLETVATSYNATDVPVAIVNTVGALLTALGTATKPGLPTAKAPTGAKESLDVGSVTDAPFYIRQEKSIEPGVYRVQKSWERAAAAPLAELPADELCGLFSSVGLPLVDSVAVIDAAAHTAETTPQTAALASPPQN